MYKLVVVAIEKLNVESYDQTVGTDSQNKQMTLDDVIEDKKASSNNRQNELQLALKTEFEKMCIEMGNKGNDVVEIFNLKLQGLASAEIQRKLGMTRSVERSLEKKGMEFLRNSSTLQLFASEMC